MKYLALIIILALIVSSCGSTKNKRIVTTKKQSKTQKSKPKSIPEKTVNTTPATNNSMASQIINNAEKYKGTRYKYGGTTAKGMDCSGLVYTAFKEADIVLPRVSGAMATQGDWVDVKTVQVGDLLFFATAKNSRKVNHVGIVTALHDDTVSFIHSSSSKGVITSKLKEKYWYFAFVQARRVL